jgi:hypothetical protein
MPNLRSRSKADDMLSAVAVSAVCCVAVAIAAQSVAPASPPLPVRNDVRKQGTEILVLRSRKRPTNAVFS